MRTNMNTKKPTRETGLSLLELLIAMALLAVIAIGVLPLLMRAMADRNRAWEATEVSGFAQSELEPMLAASYESDVLSIDATATERLSTEVWAEGEPHLVGDANEGWTNDPTGKNKVLWERNTFVRWYGVEDLEAPLKGDVEPTAVNLKEIQVQIVGQRQGGALGAGQELWIRVFKAF